jgi:uncharacterized protein involved in type VI secretion and phage assembly
MSETVSSQISASDPLGLLSGFTQSTRILKLTTPLGGHVVAIEMAGANGGFARYNLTVEPWIAFLSLGRDSRIFQDMTVFDILDTVFTAYQGQGKLTPAWRFDIVDRNIYPKRSITTQYQESDRAFAERLMHEEGLFHYFEHTGDAASPGLGSHTMVIADHNGSFKPNAQASIAFSQPGATMREDTLDRWRTGVRLRTNAIELSSWDYRSLDSRPSAPPAPISATARRWSAATRQAPTRTSRANKASASPTTSCRRLRPARKPMSAPARCARLRRARLLR